ncbi:carbohydrate kinase family protein [candidate division KSB1 bacterium]|nr:carbohydrate kinase family protein [candidate division KSB1 bacterium]
MSIKKTGIACAGNWIIDRTKVIDAYPAESTLANIFTETRGGGGCAYNVILNLAKFDPQLPLWALGCIGDDSDAEWILDDCRQYKNINLDFLARTTLAHTSYTDVYCVQKTGKRTFFHYRGANAMFGIQHVDINRLKVSFFHLGYLLLLDTLDSEDQKFGRQSARLLHDLKTQGIQTSIDLVSAPIKDYGPYVFPALRYTDYCIMNDYEAEHLTGIQIYKDTKISKSGLKKIGGQLFHKGVGNLVVVHFPQGAYAQTSGGKEYFQPALNLPMEFIAGSTGAGDSFCAGILYGIYNNWPLEKSLQFAVCAGAQNLGNVTTTGAITNADGVFELSKKFPSLKAGNIFGL